MAPFPLLTTPERCWMVRPQLSGTGHPKTLSRDYSCAALHKISRNQPECGRLHIAALSSRVCCRPAPIREGDHERKCSCPGLCCLRVPDSRLCLGMVEYMPPPNLRLVLLVYLALGWPAVRPRSDGDAATPGRLMVAGNIAHVQLVTIGMAVWLMQRHVYLSRAPPAMGRAFPPISPTPPPRPCLPRASALSSIWVTPTRSSAPGTICGACCSASRCAPRQHFSAITAPGTRP